MPKGRLDNVLWVGHDPGGRSQRVTSALTKLRKRLGEGPDGELLVPRRQGDEPIEVSEHVGRDLDRALAHLAVARDLPAELATRELAAALEPVRGEPFDGRAYSWATDVEQRAIVQLQDAALEAARALREAGDLAAADTVITQGSSCSIPTDGCTSSAPSWSGSVATPSSHLGSSRSTGASSPKTPTKSPARSQARHLR